MTATRAPRNEPCELNSAGLEPKESRALSERTALAHEKPLLKSIRELYSCNPTNESFNMYSSDATFEDPIGTLKGTSEIRKRFARLAKLYSAEISNFRVLDNPSSVPSTIILIDQDVTYHENGTGDVRKSSSKTINSLLVFKVDGRTNQVTMHCEDWNHRKSSTGEDGISDWMKEQRKGSKAAETSSAVRRSKD
ncbi:hypothetical protein CC1G_13716 [Coprinopsis cinerea okayama7|uniref:SnoaL-like domain-containing protein n=1 Tax=Coprinopsis cinerea (strain Okayama-7 / 130 / ATCC MYA-4618 / FGSC 9003) TaxID=240176 RepID=D6RK54_COPC7|nr:hypothetical protein CC1G_13716 [Coprinopsis cinerea okayama7\|eukprot:XP_002912184.1 hypothetical protein CC1G_13716 [Coprinopsis cinerea okayama7\